MKTQTQTTAHTPGPWFTANGGQSIRVENRDFLVAKVGNSRPKDARLIAAAPDLLAACKAVAQLRGSIMTWALGNSIPGWQNADALFASIEAAIARATGESK